MSEHGEAACLCDEGFEADAVECVPAGADGDGDGDVDTDVDRDADTSPVCRGETLTPGMVLVPEGPFLMGCNVEVEECAEDRGYLPLHEVYLDSYEIGRTEVTVAEYGACVEAGTCEEPISWDEDDSSRRACNWGRHRREVHPVNCVSWYQAQAYCAWAGARLCTEAEWEKAGRGTDSRPYPWGTEPATCELAAIGVSGGRPIDCLGPEVGTWPVGLAVPDCSPYGAQDMLGNVTEWVQDWYDPEYYEVSPARNPPGPDGTGDRVQRGAHFALAEAWVQAVMRLSGRTSLVPDAQAGWQGIRCCRSVPGT